MTDVKSKNLYELLGNDHDQDSDKEPEPPVKTVDKPLPRTGKRDGPAEPAAPAPRRDADRRTGGFSNDERRFRDRTNGRNRPEGVPEANRNRDQPIENTDGTVKGRDSGPGTQRGGRGRGGPRRGGDRHSRTGRGDHAKQVGHGWGENTGEGEQVDEVAGEQQAQEDRKEANAEDAAIPEEPIAEPEPEPEDTSISYSQYLEQQAAKKLEGLGLKEARAANEGAKDNKKWKNATALSKEGQDEAYFEGQAKAKRERERAQKKQLIDIDYAFKEPARSERGGRGDFGGRGRGSRGRGEARGGRGRGGFENDRPRGGGDRGSYRGGRGRSDGQQPQITDESAFPSLGGK